MIKSGFEFGTTATQTPQINVSLLREIPAEAEVSLQGGHEEPVVVSAVEVKTVCIGSVDLFTSFVSKV